MSASKEKPLSKLSPFTVQKGFQAIALSLKEATGVYKERSRETTSVFRILERYTMSHRSTSYSIIFEQKAQQSPNIGTKVTYYRL